MSSCRCPAKHGKACWLTTDECRARRDLFTGADGYLPAQRKFALAIEGQIAALGVYLATIRAEIAQLEGK